MVGFIIIGNQNAITYKEIFPYIKNNELWLGVHSNKTMDFAMPNTYEKWDRIEKGVKIGKVPAISWFTNIPHKKRIEELVLYKEYSADEYPKYDNYDAINIDKTADIPMDYEGVMGVPITFLDKYCPTQFEIIGLDRYVEDNPRYGHRFTIRGKETYARILIRRKKAEPIVEYGKKFLIIGNQNAITYKEIFPYIKNNELWLGMNWVKDFVQYNGEVKKFGNACWFTNIPHIKQNKPLILTKTYNPIDYPHYDNYDAINVNKVKDIPIDYDGVMGVPITFFDKYCPTQFEILGIANDVRWIGDFPCLTIIKGEKVYNRILIRRK